MKFDPQQMTVKQTLLVWILAALLGVPAEYMIDQHVGFGPWITDFQDHMIGGHLSKFSFMMVVLLEVFCIGIPIMIVGILVRCIAGRAHQAAKVSLVCAVAILILLMVGRRTGALQGVGGISMVLMAGGLLLGIIALFGIRKHGVKGILAPALTGIAINGTLLFIFATSFFAARSTADAHASVWPGFNPAAWFSSGANTHARYKIESLSFDYPTAYKLKKTHQAGQILLENADSIVLIKCLSEDIDVDCTLNSQLDSLQEGYRNDNSCTGFARTDIKKIDGTILPGNLMRMQFDDPVLGRCYIDAYCLSGTTNYISVWHIYGEKTKTTSDRLFATVLHSLTDGPGASPASGKPATVLAAVPAAIPTGPPELKSIMWIPTRPSAQLDKSFAFEGDTVRGYKVTKISHDSVDLLTPEGASLRLVLAAEGARSRARNVD